MKVVDFAAPLNPDSQYDKALARKLVDYFRDMTRKVNGLASGSYNAVDNALTAAPTSGTWAQGDFVRNSSPSELGAASSMYVIYGFLCVAGGTPGTWVECRFLTGN
jgi:hypothetical protein